MVGHVYVLAMGIKILFSLMMRPLEEKKRYNNFSIDLEKIELQNCPGSQHELLAGTVPVGVFIFSSLKGYFVIPTPPKWETRYVKLTSRTLPADALTE